MATLVQESAGGVLLIGAVTLYAAMLGYAAASDFMKFEIPNHIPALVIASFVLALATAPHLFFWQGSVLSFVATFAVGYCLFAIGAFGGGDVKLMTATALWGGGLGQMSTLVLVTGLAGGLVAGTVLLSQRMTPADQRQTPKVPYGVAIACGGVVAVLPTLQGLLL